eukprot:CAMPEP_0204244084 /NCGR_PEP_ID=MMETSP0361-20130328/96800_1 /ASSEMBLY_ACC=CAM_ASM_000343 /TAXON_ID=268821 /ORGANISM="Scrippsiella Hangoei, Strain SHTV-5" /LENGTH=105 /DNA_ID=CAMNT_0051217061 /DNA_START=162 /DNA_END=475 /DNA_ORIENTATION=-
MRIEGCPSCLAVQIQNAGLTKSVRRSGRDAEGSQVLDVELAALEGHHQPGLHIFDGVVSVLLDAAPTRKALFLHRLQQCREVHDSMAEGAENAAFDAIPEAELLR